MNRRYHTNPITPHGTELSITDGSFCFPCFMNPEVKGIDIKRKRDEEYRLGIPGTTGQSWQMLLFGQQGRALRFREKSSSLRCGIFPENLALPEAFTAGPL